MRLNVLFHLQQLCTTFRSLKNTCTEFSQSFAKIHRYQSCWQLAPGGERPVRAAPAEGGWDRAGGCRQRRGRVPPHTWWYSQGSAHHHQPRLLSPCPLSHDSLGNNDRNDQPSRSATARHSLRAQPTQLRTPSPRLLDKLSMTSFFDLCPL